MARGWWLRTARLFDGDRFHEDVALGIEDGLVVGLAPNRDVPAAEETVADALVAPGFVDWQVNGGGGALFNAAPTPEALGVIAAAHARLGTTALLPTFITDRADAMDEAADAVATALARSVPGVVGVHFEGPHIAVARAGAHDPAFIRPIEAADRKRLARAALGVRVVTVAPETVGDEDIAALKRAGVRVSLGHSDCGYDRAAAAFRAGAAAVTHLFNAMSPLGHRAPGLVGAALDHPGAWAGIIADGLHVHPAALRLARSVKGERLTLVSDAMPTVGWEGDRFHLNGREVRREGERLTLADGTLAGAHLDMAGAVRFMVERADAPLREALRMASLGPARLLGLERDRGHLRPGARADLVALDLGLRPVAAWIGGARVEG